jgi:hypothetical protein
MKYSISICSNSRDLSVKYNVRTSVLYNRPEDKVPWSDLISECFTDLSDAEGYLHATCTLHILEVCKDSLSRLWPKVGYRRCVLRIKTQRYVRASFEQPVQAAAI